MSTQAVQPMTFRDAEVFLVEARLLLALVGSTDDFCFDSTTRHGFGC
jgi:hypothetical protein